MVLSNLGAMPNSPIDRDAKMLAHFRARYVCRWALIRESSMYLRLVHAISRGLLYLLLSVLPVIANADWMTGQQLYVLYLAFSGSSQGKSGSEYENAGVYFGYVIGVVNATDGLARNKIYCLPAPGAGATGEQLAHVVGAYLAAHPNERDGPAIVLIYKAMKNAFPCN